METDGAAQAFRAAVAELQAAVAAQGETRPELTFEGEPPPRRLAPYATAVAATAADADQAGADDADIASGRFILLYDPAGQPGWDARFRVIAYVRAELEPEMAADPLISEVGWSWLTEALDTSDAGYLNISGTVTTEVTQGFGGKQDEPTATGFELRASWSPAADASGETRLDGHLAAWCAVICAAAGLPPSPPGVTTLRPPRRRRQQ